MKFVELDVFNAHGHKLGACMMVNMLHIVSITKAESQRGIKIRTVDGSEFHTSDTCYKTICEIIKSDDPQ